MSWDVVIFSSKQKIPSIGELDETMLVPIDFSAILEKYCNNIEKQDNYWRIKGEDFSISHYIHPEPVSNTIFSLHDENALCELVRLAEMCDWQIFDTGIEDFIDMDDPARNGYENFQAYLEHVRTKTP